MGVMRRASGTIAPVRPANRCACRAYRRGALGTWVDLRRHADRRAEADAVRCILACGVALTASLAVAQAPPKTPPKTHPNLPPIPFHLLRRPPIQHGLTHVVKVKQPMRLDWAFTLPADVPAFTPGHDPSQTTYQLFVPPRYKHKQG